MPNIGIYDKTSHFLPDTMRRGHVRLYLTGLTFISTTSQLHMYVTHRGTRWEQNPPTPPHADILPRSICRKIKIFPGPGFWQKRTESGFWLKGLDPEKTTGSRFQIGHCPLRILAISTQKEMESTWKSIF